MMKQISRILAFGAVMAPTLLAGCSGSNGTTKPLPASAGFTFSDAVSTNADLTMLNVIGTANDEYSNGLYAEYSESNTWFYTAAQRVVGNSYRYIEFAQRSDDPSRPPLNQDFNIGNGTNDIEAAYGENNDTTNVNGDLKIWRATAGKLKVISINGKQVTVRITDMRVVSDPEDSDTTGAFTINGTYTYRTDKIIASDSQPRQSSADLSRTSRTAIK